MNTNTTSDPIDLARQVAIITGGGRGIGRAIAQTLAKAGAKVVVAARSPDQLAETVALVEADGGHAQAITTDVTDQGAVENMVHKVVQDMGPVDLLVNNAGIAGPGGPLWQNDPGAWWQCLEVNLRGMQLCSQAVLPVMVERQQGRIINIASGAGPWPTPYGSAYGVSKCAVLRLSEIMALELKAHNIAVFALHPGIVHTQLMQGIVDSPADEEWFDGYHRRLIEDGVTVPPQCAADLVQFLASGRADALSGCYFDVDMDMEDILQNTDNILENDLYKLRLHTLTQ